MASCVCYGKTLLFWIEKSLKTECSWLGSIYWYDTLLCVSCIFKVSSENPFGMADCFSRFSECHKLLSSRCVCLVFYESWRKTKKIKRGRYNHPTGTFKLVPIGMGELIVQFSGILQTDC